MSSPKLPKAVAQLVEKGNFVAAIKSLADAENISMGEAKDRIDDYDLQLKTKQQQKLSSIANKQGIPSGAMNFSNDPEPVRLTEEDLEARKNSSPFAALSSGLDNRLDDMGYKKPLLPSWVKRVTLILIVMAIIFWGLWRAFG